MFLMIWKAYKQGCLFILPSGLDNAPGGIFKVLRMTNVAIYPASIACELGLVFLDTDEAATINDFHHSNFNLLDAEND